MDFRKLYSLLSEDTLGRAYRGARTTDPGKRKQTYEFMKQAQSAAKNKKNATVMHMISADRFISKVGTDGYGRLRVPFEDAVSNILQGKAGEISVSVESAPWSLENTVVLIGETDDLLEYYEHDSFTKPTPVGKVPQNFENAGGAWDEGVVDSSKVKWHTVYVDDRVADMFPDEDPEQWFEQNYPRIEYCDDLDCIRQYTEEGSDRQMEEQDKNFTIRDWEYEMRPLFMTGMGRSYRDDIQPDLKPFQKPFGELQYEMALADEEGVSIAHLFEGFKSFREKLAPVLRKFGEELQPSDHEEHL